MKRPHLPGLCAAVCALLLTASCVRDEALSPECDITEVSAQWLAAQPAGGLLGTPIIKQSQPATVTFFIPQAVRDSALRDLSPQFDIRRLNPQFAVSTGATLYLNDGAGTLTPYDAALTRDFTQPKLYSVTSEDRRFTKDYSVSFAVPQPVDSCTFESYSYDNESHNYMTLLQQQEDGSLNAHIWDSGNAGYKLTGMASTPEAYPTVFAIDSITGSRCAKLTTCTTGNFGMMTRPRMPIAAGNLFIGEFRIAQAMLAPRKATRFGLQIVKGEPATLSGWYRYTAGPTFTDKDKNVRPELHDTADIYAVLYEVDPDNFQPLDGDSILSSSRTVSLARIADPGEPQQWTFFSEPFRPQNGKTFSAERLQRNGYAIAIVMTSSRQGAYFEGAVGSELWVDNIKITYK